MTDVFHGYCEVWQRAANASPSYEAIEITSEMTGRGASILRHLLGEQIGTQQELEELAWAVLAGVLRFYESGLVERAPTSPNAESETAASAPDDRSDRDA
jgi:hypothetical protein